MPARVVLADFEYAQGRPFPNEISGALGPS